MAPTLAIQEQLGGIGDVQSRVHVPLNKTSALPNADVKEESGSGSKGWKDVGSDANGKETIKK